MSRLNWTADSMTIKRIRSAAPTRTVSENDGRRGGYYGGEDRTTRSFHSVLVYIAKGLGDHKDALIGVANTALAVQKGGCRRWNLYPMAFGSASVLHHDRKFFEFGYTSDWMNDGPIAEVLSRLSGTMAPDGPAILTQLFPPHGTPRFKVLKSGPDLKDLMVLICGKEGFRIDHALSPQLTASLRRRILVARIQEDGIVWEFGDIEEEDFFPSTVDSGDRTE